MLPWKVVIFMILVVQFIWCIPVSPLNHTHKTQTHSTSVTAINCVIVAAPADETEYTWASPRTHRHTQQRAQLSTHTDTQRIFAELRRHKQTARVCGEEQENEKEGGGVQHGEKKGGTQWGVNGRRSNKRQSVYWAIYLFSSSSTLWTWTESNLCVCVCVCSKLQRSVRSSACKNDRQLLTERQSEAAERCSFVLSWLAEVNAILSVRPSSQWHALVTLTGWHHRWHHRP